MKTEREKMPDGKYLVTLFDVERIEDGREVDLECRFEVLQGPSEGRRFSERIKADGRRRSDWAKGQWILCRLAECVGRERCTDDPWELLTGRPFFVEVEGGRIRRVYEGHWRYRNTTFALRQVYRPTEVAA